MPFITVLTAVLVRPVRHPVAYHGQWAIQSSKDTIRQRKSTRFECFWPNEWTRQQQAGKCICIKRSVQTERWFDCHRQWTMQSSKDTKRQRKSTRFECFWPNEWTRSTASEQMYLHRAQRADRKVVRLPQAGGDAIVQGHERQRKSTRFECFWLD